MWLNLNNNQFQGKLPLSLSNMKNLTLLDVWGESTISEFPDFQILRMKRNQLYVNLDLSNNLLSGLILTRISFLSRFIRLNFSYNNLSVKFPEMIGDIRSMIGLTFLSRLNLSYNKLSGPIQDGNQFQTFNDPSYTGNQHLYVAPLPKYCPSDGPCYVPTFKDYEDEERKMTS
ncbi:hypothetical protein Ahy_A05g021991 isoform A [Arachis hypogaea]|uniref:Uncharacterized protein n=1 Tax=Arachis hypogaea TaxID=3818 RepID=A0A445CZ71_ARAHY|nr:hypothetical protein Ahy_A05g021991 isoform A [Arachis hypogaea]